ncbi:MAG TPA: molybdopterin molybdotransferase MoeA [Steroidobacteraceae bacterium]|nr:molybdopterin molybdotransferase MoeA [Steroidobacteraceae bacterium]
MRGFTPITPQEAEAAIDARVTRLPAEARPLAQCIGQTLREDIYAERDNPPFDRVCMDGIAIRSESLSRGIRRFALQGMQAAGMPALELASDDGAVEVMTGAILPRGADCVIPLEEYEQADGVVSLKAQAVGPRFRNVQRRGEDSRPGVPMLRAGTRLGPAEVAVAASSGRARVQVSRQPRFMVISTGDELVEPGEPIAEHQVRRSNAYALVAALRARGFEHVADDHLLDDERMLRERLTRHLAAHDVLIVSGGVSKGKYDLVPKVLKELGVAEVFHQVAQRPGMPMWFGTGPSGQLVFGLPGNPVSTLICLVRYVVPAVVAAMGTRLVALRRIALAAPVKLGRPMTSFLPVSVQYDELGRPAAVPRPTNGPGDFLALTQADGFIELPPRAEEFPQGFVASLYRW